MVNFTCLSFISLLSLVAAKSKVSINLQNGNFAGLEEGLNPILNFEGSSKEGDVEYAYGLNMALNPTKNIKSLPRSIWGKTKASIGGWMTSIKAEVDAQKLDCIDFVVTSDKVEHALSLKAIGSYSKSNHGSLSKVQGTKTYKINDNNNVDSNTKVSITPRYNMKTEEADVVIGYVQEKDDENGFEIIASKETQQITLYQKVKNDHRISTTLATSSNNGSRVSFEWENIIGENKSVTTCVKPDQSIDVNWKDNGWDANINLPLDGLMDIKGLNVVIKRKLTF